MVSMKNRRILTFIENNLALALLTISIIVCDRLVKFYITENLNLGESISVIGAFLQITRVENGGAAFGLMQGWTMFFIIASFAVFGLIIFYYNKIIENRMLVFSTAFILGGAVGNLLDRVFFGHVIDYVNFMLWPAFNISDMALTTGAILLAIYIFKTEDKVEDKDSRIEFARY